MLRLVGEVAYSQFRLSQFLKRLQQHLPTLMFLEAHYEYFINAQLTPSEETLLQEILEAQNPTANEEVYCLWVLPRFGTQSAWGSKALDILHNVGLTSVNHIERAIVFTFQVSLNSLSASTIKAIAGELHDRMTQTVITNWQDASMLFQAKKPVKMQFIDVLAKGQAALNNANVELGLALNGKEIDYLYQAFVELKRNPTDAELMMFAQANSEHCRHKIFKANWEIDGIAQPDTLFDMIKNTYQHNNNGILSAYHDNAAVVQGFGRGRFYCAADGTYAYQEAPIHLLMKVETHNHPTAIEPFAGAGTGQGGEIRDEGATGRGAKPKAGLTGFTVSNLHIPECPQPWENVPHYPSRISTALDIMLKGPIGGAAFNNEFGRPNICGYFRSFEQAVPVASKGYFAYGYHKPIMLAGGMGNISQNNIHKKPLPEGTLLVVLGGPAMRIGLGGGAASSLASGSSKEELDYASVQRQNPEMQRRCQEVIDTCVAQNENPILSIHDVGAGGLANALPEIVHDCEKGARIDLRKIPNAESGMSALEIWCNESQERYVLAIDPKLLSQFETIVIRERCPYAILGEVTLAQHLEVLDETDHKPIDLPQAVLFGHIPRINKQAKTRLIDFNSIKTDLLPLSLIIERILQCPTVADKSFLITIGDRTVGGLTARDQMVGPWQIPVADCAVSATSYLDFTGEAMSMGERPPIALINPAAGARMAISEAVLNILSANIQSLSDIRLSCNWMAAANSEFDADLFHSVKAVGKELCPSWDITIPVGKDSLSMRTTWQYKDSLCEVISPVTLVVSAFAPVKDIRQTLTPYMQNLEKTALLFIDLAANKKRLGGSIYAQVTNQLGNVTPDMDFPEVMKNFLVALNQLKQRQLILAYHDRSDGGLFVTLCEMAFASGCGLNINLDTYITDWDKEAIPALFNEESGVVIQVASQALESIKAIFADVGLKGCVHEIATITQNEIGIYFKGEQYFSQNSAFLQSLWSKTSYLMQSLRDNPECAESAYQHIVQNKDTALFTKETLIVPKVQKVTRGNNPKIAILREQGVNGHIEMAAAFSLAGFDAVDVSMSDLLAGKDLKGFQGLAACGGFSYGDVLGAGKGWAKTILYQSRLRELFADFFERKDTFTLGVCNGCQMLAALKELIPGAAHWPQFIQNTSEQFEARLSMVEVCHNKSVLLQDLKGMMLPIVVSHGEGKVDFSQNTTIDDDLIALRYIDTQGNPTEVYPFNPNGSKQGMTGFTTTDGRVTIMMPHPERVIKTWQFSWYPQHWQENSPWFKLFVNARQLFH